ncbi:hypothetical protein LY625_03900 [Lysobacter sp. GX 14042]|uniref:hypothetical protein n=1 Tax=Lysobacter sp. GX 14042 TaxID=2907155 RepID=UPI001F2874B0|nr:hypothetical protein [Lysobacter sp. GX 14042]MCE7031767.1 hypothetical protein [Lysobacter sp. GX 14042]
MKPCPLADFRAAFDSIPTPVDPRDFIRPDGSYDVTPENLGEHEHVQAAREFVASDKAGAR